MKYRVIEETRDHVVVHKDHRLANASYVKLSDFKDDTFIMVSPEDSEESPKLIIDACKMSGFNPQVSLQTLCRRRCSGCRPVWAYVFWIHGICCLITIRYGF